mgnify:FL=1
MRGCGSTAPCRCHLSRAGVLLEPQARPPFVEVHALFYCGACDLVIEVRAGCACRRLVRTFPLAGSVGFRPKL